MQEFLRNILLFQKVMDIMDLCFGTALVFGALKWRRGLIAYTALAWGAALGLLMGLELYSVLRSGTAILFLTAAGAVVFCILTFTIAGVNRFVVGFLVLMKLSFMLTTWLFKSGGMGLEAMFVMPLIIGAIAGLIFMAWRSFSILPFVLACTFLGASQVAPTIAKYINQFLFGITGDFSMLFDPVDFIFALFKIELTDGWTLVILLILMAIGIPVQIQSVFNQGFGLDTPVITYETECKEKHGKIVRR